MRETTVICINKELRNRLMELKKTLKHKSVNDTIQHLLNNIGTPE